MQVVLVQALFIEVVNDVLGDLADDRLAVEEAELIGQVIVKRPRPRGHVLHGFLLAVGLFAERSPAAPGSLVVDLAPVFIERDQAFELVGLRIRHRLFRLGRRRVVIARLGRRRFSQIFEDRILAELLLDPFLQCHDRQLQNLHRLDHARRHPKAHLRSHLLRRFEPHYPCFHQIAKLDVVRLRHAAPPLCTSIEIPSPATIMPQLRGGQGAVVRKPLKWLSAGECVGEHVAIGEFKRAAGCQPAGEPGDADLGVAQAIGDQKRSAVPFEVWVRRQDQLADGS